MARLTDEQRASLKEFLIKCGLTFPPLLDELADHIACDIEERMREGEPYEEAWKHSVSELPENHFQSIQRETMETIDRRFNLGRVFTYVALSALIFGTVFKTLHLQGTDGLILISFFSLAAALVASSLSGIYVNRQKKGAVNILGVVAGTILMITGYAFKIFHLPGADEIIIAATIVSLVFMAINTFYVYKETISDLNLLSYLHEKHTPGIERFLLVLLVPVTVYQVTGWIAGLNHLFVPLILLVAIYSASLQFIALAWRSVSTGTTHKNPFTLALVVVSFVCMTLPMMAEMLPFSFRLSLVVCFFFIAAILALRLESTQRASNYLVYAAPVLISLLALTRIGWIDFGHSVTVNVIVTAILTTGVFLSARGSIVRTFLILSVAVYLLEASTLDR
jgi:hypothetical protein